MKKAPANWPRISSSVYYQNPAAAIDWLCRAFGFEVRLKIVGEGGRIDHSELLYGEGLIMVGSGDKEAARPETTFRASPRSLGGKNTQNMMVYVDDVEAHCTHARAAGAQIVVELHTTDYGPEYWTDRGYQAEDLEGHHWWFYQRLRDAKS